MTQSTDEQRAAKSMAARMVDEVAKCSRRNIHFEVILESETVFSPTTKLYRTTYREPPFPIMWRRKNVRGVTYLKSQTEEAAAWIRTALLAGYTVCCGTRKRGWYRGRSLQDGPAYYWE